MARKRHTEEEALHVQREIGVHLAGRCDVPEALGTPVSVSRPTAIGDLHETARTKRGSAERGARSLARSRSRRERAAGPNAAPRQQQAEDIAQQWAGSVRGSALAGQADPLAPAWRRMPASNEKESLDLEKPTA